jgi:hypothetical protein
MRSPFSRGNGPLSLKRIVALIGEPDAPISDIRERRGARGSLGRRLMSMAIGHVWQCGCAERCSGLGSRTWWPCEKDESLARQAMNSRA